MRSFVSIALVTFLVVVLIARALPLLGFDVDPIGSFFESVYGNSPRALLATVLVLMATAFSLVIYRWRRNPGRGFPWLDIGSYSVALIVVIVVCVKYSDALRP